MKRVTSYAQLRALPTLKDGKGAERVATVYYCGGCKYFEWVPMSSRRKRGCDPGCHFSTIGGLNWEFTYRKDGKLYRTPAH